MFKVAGPKPEASRSIEDVRRIVRQFNLTFTVGDYVILRTDQGEVETILESPPWIGRDMSVVARFRGVDGLQSIENGRVRHLSPTPAA
jgi:hypothetical protein